LIMRYSQHPPDRKVRVRTVVLRIGDVGHHQRNDGNID
jgi:hypothetical protein